MPLASFTAIKSSMLPETSSTSPSSMTDRVFGTKLRFLRRTFTMRNSISASDDSNTRWPISLEPGITTISEWYSRMLKPSARLSSG